MHKRTFFAAQRAARKLNPHYVRHAGIIVGCFLIALFAISLSTSKKQNKPFTYQKNTPAIQHIASKASGVSNIHASLADDHTLYDTWVYPDAPGALAALQDGNHNIFALKAEFLHVNDDGSLMEYDQSDTYPNGYSPANVALMSRHSQEQYVTVSGDMAGTTLAMQNAPQTIQTMVNLANKAGFGIELDWEEFGQWTPQYYQSYMQFLQRLGDALHDNGHQLMVDGPPIYDSTSQGWYQWKYQEIAPLVDSAVMMIYDNEYDTGVGNSIAPRDWSLACMRWLKDTAGDKGIAGIASYGYTGDKSNGRIAVNGSGSTVHKASALALSFSRNADGELTASDGTTFYDYSDRETMDTRLAEVNESGIGRLSVWSLGDNPWF